MKLLIKYRVMESRPTQIHYHALNIYSPHHTILAKWRPNQCTHSHHPQPISMHKQRPPKEKIIRLVHSKFMYVD